MAVWPPTLSLSVERDFTNYFKNVFFHIINKVSLKMYIAKMVIFYETSGLLENNVGTSIFLVKNI